MKTSTLTLIVLSSLLVISTVKAATPADASSGKGSSATAEAELKRSQKKTTDVSFEDVLVQGKYHFSDEAVTTVEDDKVLDALLGVRTDFKDRLKKSSARH